MLVWRRKHEEWITPCTILTVKSGRFSLSMLCYIGWHVCGYLQFIDVSLKKEKYIEISGSVNDKLREEYWRHWELADDNAPPHVVKIVNAYKKEHGIKCLDSSAQSPYLNFIENAWLKMKQVWGKLNPLQQTQRTNMWSNNCRVLQIIDQINTKKMQINDLC